MSWRVVKTSVRLARGVSCGQGWRGFATETTGEINAALLQRHNFRQRLEKIKAEALAGGGEKRIEGQHSKGKLTARERLSLLLDEGSFREYDQLKTHRCEEFDMGKQVYYGDGCVTGHGLIHGRPVFVYSQDFTVLGGSLSETMAQKICKVMDMAMRVGKLITRDS